MSDVEFEDSDFTEAVSHLQHAGEDSVESFCPAFSALGSALVESALGRTDTVIRSAMRSLAGVGGDLAADISTVHAALRRTDAQLAGAAR